MMIKRLKSVMFCVFAALAIAIAGCNSGSETSEKCKQMAEADCKGSKECTFTASGTCVEASPSVYGRCSAVQIDTSCTPPCVWDAVKLTCGDEKKI